MLLIQRVSVEAMPNDLPVLVASPVMLPMLMSMGKNGEGVKGHGQAHPYSFNVALL